MSFFRALIFSTSLRFSTFDHIKQNSYLQIHNILWNLHSHLYLGNFLFIFQAESKKNLMALFLERSPRKTLTVKIVDAKIFYVNLISLPKHLHYFHFIILFISSLRLFSFLFFYVSYFPPKKSHLTCSRENFYIFPRKLYKP